MFLKIIKFFVYLTIFTLFGSVITGYVIYKKYSKDLPQIEKLSDYNPKAVTSVYSKDGVLIAEIFDDGRRYPVKIQEIPANLKNAFLAAEDANFYTHPGIDIQSVIRALYVNFKKKTKSQGASTITQQIIKSLLLTKEKTLERKIKEAILAYKLEKSLTKDEIFEIYLNEIFLGNGANGVRAAGKTHFHKELNDLTIAECAFLAALPKKPSELMMLKNRTMAIERRHYVLDQMLKNNFTNAEQYKEARAQQLKIYLPDEKTIFDTPYFSTYIVKKLREDFAQYLPKGTATDPGGYTVITSIDTKINELARLSLRKGLREVDQRHGWRGPKKNLNSSEIPEYVENLKEIADVTMGVVTNIKGQEVEISQGQNKRLLDLKESNWAKTLVVGEGYKQINLEKFLKAGDVLETEILDEKRVKISQTPILQAATLIINPFTGEINAMIGGYEFDKNVFNRTVQALRQPGSSFKPIVYLSAVESLGYTPSTIVQDSPISLNAGNGKIWAPKNFDGEFLGPITLRTALQRSRNVVSVHLAQALGLKRIINTAKRLGITTPIAENLSISLGAAEVPMIELVRAYGTFATGGYLAEELSILEIKDRNGKTIYRQYPKQKRVIAEEDAFIMAQMMKGVVERGTATILKKVGKVVAGKTGTTNDQMDAWFIGYTPEYTGGVWVGYDQKKNIGRNETGGKVSAPIFLYILETLLKDTSPKLDFTIPENVVPVTVELGSGRPSAGGFVEYFKRGTEPKPSESVQEDDYLKSEEY